MNTSEDMSDALTTSNTSDAAVATTIGTPPSDGQSTVLLVQAVLYYSIGCLGFTGNLVVVIVIFQYTKMRRVLTNMYVINQSMIDGLAGLALVFSRVWQFEHDRPLHGVAGELFCRLWATRFVVWALVISSTFNLMALTIERYLAIVHPVLHRVSFTGPKVVLSIVGVWMSGFIIQLAYKVPTSGLTPDGRCLILGFFPSPEAKKAVGSLIIIVQFFMPLAVMSFCYGCMFSVLKGKAKVQPITIEPKDAGPAVVAGGSGGAAPRAGEGGDDGGGDQDRNTRARRNILKTFGIVSACFGLCWIWNQAYYLLTNIGLARMHHANPFVTFSLFSVYVNTCINPVIYVVHYEQFRRGLRVLRRRLVCGHGHIPGGATSTGNTGEH